jgi:hypothetical protein
MERVWKEATWPILRLYLSIFLEIGRKITKSLPEQPASGCPEYKAGMLTTRLSMFGSVQIEVLICNWHK